MNQSNEFTFDVPQRQSPVAILLVVIKAFFNIIRQLWPVLILFYFGKSSNSFNSYILYAVIGISVMSAVYSIINYFRTYYLVVNNELTLTSGILSSKRVTVPFDRIQSINLEQNIIHRLFNVQRLKIDTAGTTEKEVEISALKTETAEALRGLLLKNKAYVLPNVDRIDSTEPKSEKEVLSLSLGSLIKIGLLENHIKSGWIIFGFGWWIYFNLQEFGIETFEYIEKYSMLLLGLTIFLGFAFLFVVVSVLISLIRTIVTYYNLKFIRSDKGFKITYGLFNNQMVSALDHKIQTVSWADNLLKRAFKIFDLKLRQASSKQADTKQAIHVPGCNKEKVDAVLGFLFPKAIKEEIKLSKVHPSYLHRSIVISIIASIIPIVIGLIIEVKYPTMIGIFMLLYFPIIHYFKYNKLFYGYNKELIRIQGGVFGDKNIITPIYKIQAISKSQSPFESRRNLASLHIYNASGSETIPFIPMETANDIINVFLRKVEMDNRNWM